MASQAKGRGFEPRLSLKMLRKSLIPLVILVFVVLAALDFVPLHFPARMIFPLLWLSVCALFQRCWALATALFFSFLGDVMGWKNELIPQIGFFAIAQITYIIMFSLLFPPKPTWPKPVRITLFGLVAVVYGLAMCWIFPRVEESLIAYGIAVYAVLLLGMCYSAMQHKNVCLILGSILFVVSDFIIGINLFVERIQHAHQCIMIPYYAGQLLLFLGTRKLYLSNCTNKK